MARGIIFPCDFKLRPPVRRLRKRWPMTVDWYLDLLCLVRGHSEEDGRLEAGGYPIPADDVQHYIEGVDPEWVTALIGEGLLVVDLDGATSIPLWEEFHKPKVYNSDQKEAARLRQAKSRESRKSPRATAPAADVTLCHNLSHALSQPVTSNLPGDVTELSRLSRVSQPVSHSDVTLVTSVTPTNSNGNDNKNDPSSEGFSVSFPPLSHSVAYPKEQRLTVEPKSAPFVNQSLLNNETKELSLKKNRHSQGSLAAFSEEMHRRLLPTAAFSTPRLDEVKAFVARNRGQPAAHGEITSDDCKASLVYGTEATMWALQQGKVKTNAWNYALSVAQEKLGLAVEWRTDRERALANGEADIGPFGFEP